jgi:WS/DGAT/MGAT family acyltransferase
VSPGVTKRLSALDAAFVYMDNTTTHMHVASTAVFDPSTMPGGYAFDTVRALVESRLPRMAPFRWRLREVPLRLHHPVWVDDADFDLDYHVRRASLPAPGGAVELAEHAADVVGRPLDRRYPLWELHVVEGVLGGLFAVILKIHHAAVDGVSGLELAANLLDISVDPEPRRDEDGPWRPGRSPGDVELVADAARDLGRRACSALRAARRAAEAAVEAAVEAAADPSRQEQAPEKPVPPPGLFHAPRTPFNVPISAHRRFAFTDVSLEAVRSVRAAFGTTVNDVVLAGCAGALRRYLLEKGELSAEPLVAMVPISLRADDHTGVTGNVISAMLVRLPTDCSDAVERLHRVAETTREAKVDRPALGPSEWAELVAPTVASRAARLLASAPVMERVGPIFNVVVSNVPGPDIPLYSAGARLVSLYPMGPIVDGVALNMTVMSYLDRLYVGLVACREAVPDLADLAGAVDDSFAELFEAVPPAGGARPVAEPEPANGGDATFSALLQAGVELLG